NCSKKNFKRTLGVLMKKGLITQDEEGTRLV
ncbi:MAG: CvfB family protein, partial [Paraclostridium sp.]